MTGPLMNVAVALSEADIEEGRQRGMGRSKSMGHRETKNSKNMMGGLPWDRHVAGGIGEVGYEKWSGVKPRNIYGRGDGGVDYPDGTDAKSSPCKSKPNLLIPKDQWEREDLKARYYVLVWVRQERRDCTIIGAITREDADKYKRTSLLENQPPTWWIDRSFLGDLRMVPHIRRIFPVQMELM